MKASLGFKDSGQMAAWVRTIRGDIDVDTSVETREFVEEHLQNKRIIKIIQTDRRYNQIMGIKTIDYTDPSDEDEIENHRFMPVLTSGKVYFLRDFEVAQRLDERQTGRVAYLIDDKDRAPEGALAITGEKHGWNRHFLAAHYGEGWFRIADPEYDEIIKDLHRKIMHHAQGRPKSKPAERYIEAARKLQNNGREPAQVILLKQDGTPVSVPQDTGAAVQQVTMTPEIQAAIRAEAQKIATEILEKQKGGGNGNSNGRRSATAKRNGAASKRGGKPPSAPQTAGAKEPASAAPDDSGSVEGAEAVTTINDDQNKGAFAG